MVVGVILTFKDLQGIITAKIEGGSAGGGGGGLGVVEVGTITVVGWRN